MTAADFKLGKRPPLRYYADVAIKAAGYIAGALPATPRTWAWGRGISFGMFLNDTYGDCTCAAYGHMEQVHSTRAGRPERAADGDVFDLYHATGIDEHLGDNDGRYCEGVLSYLRRVGLRQESGDPNNPAGSYEKIVGYAAVNPLAIDEVRTAGYLFGGLYIGVALPESAIPQTGRGAWSCSATNNAPGSWGGHCVTVTAINATGPVVATWAMRQQMTWCFWKRYVDEAYAVLTDDWVENGPSPSGFKREQLVADLAAL